MGPAARLCDAYTADVGYNLSTTNLFTGSVDTGCGSATSQVGPFYCPSDDSVYLDTTFLRRDAGG